MLIEIARLSYAYYIMYRAKSAISSFRVAFKIPPNSGKPLKRVSRWTRIVCTGFRDKTKTSITTLRVDRYPSRLTSNFLDVEENEWPDRRVTTARRL